MAQRNDRSRDGGGRFARTIKTAQRDADAAALRAKGWTLQRIANELGFGSPGAVHDAIGRAFQSVATEDVAEAKRLDLERIDRLITIAWEVLEAENLAISGGRVVARCVGIERDEDGQIVRDEHGKPVRIWQDVLDTGPALNAIDRIRSLMERRARMLGYDAPVQTRVEVITSDVIEAEIARLEGQLAAAETADRPGVS